MFSIAEWLLHFTLFGATLLVRPLMASRRASKAVLLTRLDSIGDIVLFTACLPAYRRLFRDYHITLLVTEEVREIIADCPHVDEIWFMERSRFRRSISEKLRWWRRVLNQGFELAINPVYSNSFSFLDCLIGWTGSERRIAHRCVDSIRGRHMAFPFYSELVPVEEEWKFEIDRNFDLLWYLGYKGETEYQTWIWPSPVVPAVGSEQWIDDQPFIVVCPGSRDKTKMWPAEHFGAVIRQVSEHHPIRWLLCGDASEIPLCAQIAQTAGDDALNLAGRLSLRQLAGVISHAELCLGNDSGPLHLAVAQGVAGVCILGGGHHQRFYPYPGNPGTIAIDHKLPCYHCYWQCILTETECITRVSTEKVTSAILSVLRSSTKMRESHVAV